jgi:hypothetical protein
MEKLPVEKEAAGPHEDTVEKKINEKVLTETVERIASRFASEVPPARLNNVRTNVRNAVIAYLRGEGYPGTETGQDAVDLYNDLLKKEVMNSAG